MSGIRARFCHLNCPIVKCSAMLVFAFVVYFDPVLAVNVVDWRT